MSKTSKTYSEKLKDPRWQKKRLEILERDGWSCQICMSEEFTLHVHHGKYQGGLNPWDYDNKLLLTICDNHHKLIHDSRVPFEIVLLWAETKNQFDKGQLNLLFNEFILNVASNLRDKYASRLHRTL